MNPLIVTADEWAACRLCLKGEPAFILGNGPYLPEDLSALDGFFTVGVNRILLTYDPTVVQWTDDDILEDIAEHVDACQAVVFVGDAASDERFNPLVQVGNSAEPVHRPLRSPHHIAATGNMGTASALWAMSLGCSPVYLLGMSAEYDAGKTNFYGTNRLHSDSSKSRMVRALRILLEIEGVYPIRTQETLGRVTARLNGFWRGREWYLERFREAHRGVRPRQRAATAG